MASVKKAQVIITADASVAKKVMDELQQRATKAANKMRQLAAAGKQNSKEFKDAKKDFDAYNSALRENVKDTKRVEQVMKNLAGTATRDLKRALQAGKRELDKFAANDPRRQKLIADLQKINAQIQKNTGALNAMTKAQQGFGGALGTTLKNLTAYMGVFAAFNWLKGKVTDIIKGNLKLSDSLTDIRKVSGLTIQEVDKLQASLMKIDTRASVAELDKLAYAGAKLGMGQYGVAGLTSFVRAANKVNVALKEDLGEDALTAMSKLVEVMGLIPKLGIEKSMDAAGSAIFTLSTSSTATGKNIIEMSKRLMGLANVSHVTTAELLALSSASDTMGLMPEVSATAFNKFFTSIQTNTKKIEQALEMREGTLRTMIDEGRTMDAIVTVFEKMNKLGRMDAMKPLFKDLGSDGARLNAVMTTMASKVDILKNHIDMSNKSFKDATAIQKEYLMQQESAQGYMERATNIWSKAFINPEGVNVVKQLSVEWYNLSKSLTSNRVWMGQVQTSFNMLLLTLETLIKLLPVITTYLMMYGVVRAVYGVVAAYNALKVSILGARAATIALTTAQKASGWGALLSIIALGISYFLDYGDAAEEAADAQTQFNDAVAEAQSIHAKQTKQLDDYIKKLDKASGSEEERNRIIDKFNRDFGTYLNKLGIEVKTVDDLKTHYAALNEELRKKAFYEQGERLRQDYVGEAEQKQTEAMGKMMDLADKYGFSQDIIFDVTNGSNAYADEAYIFQKIYDEMYGKEFGVNGKLRWKKNNPYQYIIGEGDTRSVKPLSAGFNKTQEIYDTVMDLVNSSRDVLRRTQRVEDFMNEYAEGYEPMIIGTEPIGGDYEPGLTQKELRKLEQEEKQALRKELQDAKQESDAIISKIEEWYRLQETVITDMQADGKLTKEQAEQVVRTLNVAKNTALRDARLAISGRDTKAWEQTKKEIGNLMLDQGEWSAELLQQILDVSMESIRQNLSNIDKGGGKYGITTSSLKDAVDKNAAGNQREIARLRAKSQEEVKKILLEYHYVETAIEGFSDRLAQMGILTETAQQMAERLSDANDAETLFSMKDYDKLLQGNEQAKRDMLKDFIGNGSQKYGVNPEDKNQLRQWFMEFIGQYMQSKNVFGGVDYQYKSWAKPFEADFEMWLQNSDKYLDKIQAFYFSLIKSEDEYYEAMKKAYQKQKTLFSQRWENSGRAEYYERLLKQLDMRKRELALNDRNKGANFMDMAGFSAMNEDPEIAASLARMQQAREELETFRKTAEQKKLAGEELAAFQKNLREKEMAATEAEMSMQEQLMKSINDRISKLQEWTAPIEAFGTEVGQALYDQWHNGESMSAKWQDMLKKMGLAWGQLTVKIISELMMQRIKQNIIDRAMQADAIKHQATLATIEQTGGQTRQLVQQTTDQALIQGNQTTNSVIETQNQGHNAAMLSEDSSAAAAENPVNISRAAGKTLAGLGWWGIPLVAVVTALLNALLQAALGSSKNNSSSSSSSSNDAQKIKLVSGMLTYDAGTPLPAAGRALPSTGRALPSGSPEGRYLGTDGHVYRAANNPAPGTGLITRPIATTVQGNPALVAERGPEIVIGRRATANIMRWNPALLNVLASYDPHSRRRTYDAGTTVPSVVPALPSGSPEGQDPRMEATLGQLAQTVALLSATVDNLQKNGIPATINKYGTGGLIDEVKSGLKFDSKYGH